MGTKKSRARREPVFGSSPDLRVSAGDRPAGGKPAASRAKPGRRKSRKSRAARSLIGRLAYWSLVLALWVGIAGVGTIVWVGAHLPPIQSLEIPKRPPSIQIVDFRGRALTTRGDRAGAVLALKDLPPYVPKAFIAIEDRRFYSHYGVDPFGIGRALSPTSCTAASAKAARPSPSSWRKTSSSRKSAPSIASCRKCCWRSGWSGNISKAQILALYLNRVYFGAGAYGVEQASQRYFGKSARDISLAEAAMLAGLVRSPSRLAPTHHFAAAEKRAKVVLAAMTELGFVSKANERVAFAHPPHIVAQAGNGSINYVADWVMDALDDVLGHVDQDIVVRTSIDAGLQAEAETALADELAQKGDKNKVSEGALVAMTPKGAVRALVGGRNYADSQFNRAVAAKRQPGSAFKPFVYLTALEHGLTPDSVRLDAPIKIKGWQPENYKHEYFGPVTLAKALALSLNTVSVRLTLEFGPANVIRTAHRLGITSHLEPNASIALGTSEVSVLELVGAYAPFANGGLAVVPHVIDRITAANGKLLYAYADEDLRIVDPRYVAMMNAMLEQTLTIGTAQGRLAARLAGRRQDRHLPRFPRRLVHRLHAASGHRRLARQ